MTVGCLELHAVMVIGSQPVSTITTIIIVTPLAEFIGEGKKIR
jgi:hypothetical protein